MQDKGADTIEANEQLGLKVDSRDYKQCADTVTNVASPSVIRLRIEGLKAEAFACLQIEVWPQINNHLDPGAAMITITDQNVRVQSLPIAP